MSEGSTNQTPPCFKCSKELKPVCPDGSDRNQPYDAVTFDTHGHYGSTVFDEIDGSILQINICDDCMVQGKEHVLCRDKIPRRPLKPWVPDHAAPAES